MIVRICWYFEPLMLLPTRFVGHEVNVNNLGHLMTGRMQSSVNFFQYEPC